PRPRRPHPGGGTARPERGQLQRDADQEDDYRTWAGLQGANAERDSHRIAVAAPARATRRGRRPRRGTVPLLHPQEFLRERTMITKITGLLNRVLDEEARVQVGGIEYQVLVAEFVRRNLQTRTGQEVTLHTSHFFEGNPMQGRVVPRL